MVFEIHSAIVCSMEYSADCLFIPIGVAHINSLHYILAKPPLSHCISTSLYQQIKCLECQRRTGQGMCENEDTLEVVESIEFNMISNEIDEHVTTGNSNY